MMGGRLRCWGETHQRPRCATCALELSQVLPCEYMHGPAAECLGVTLGHHRCGPCGTRMLGNDDHAVCSWLDRSTCECVRCQENQGTESGMVIDGLRRQLHANIKRRDELATEIQRLVGVLDTTVIECGACVVDEKGRIMGYWSNMTPDEAKAQAKENAERNGRWVRTMYRSRTGDGDNG